MRTALPPSAAKAGQRPAGEAGRRGCELQPHHLGDGRLPRPCPPPDRPGAWAACTEGLPVPGPSLVGRVLARS